MGVVRRIRKLVTANVHEVINGLENPEVMLRQAVREMEDALRSAMDNAAQVIAHAKLLGRQLAEQEKRRESCLQQATGSLAKGDEALARQWLARRNEHQRILKMLSDERNCSEETANVLRQQIEGMRIRLCEARGRLLTLQARHRAALSRRQLIHSMSSAAPPSGSLDDFDRWASNIEFVEAETEALVELHQSTGARNRAEIDESDETIDSELATLKRKLAGAESIEP